MNSSQIYFLLLFFIVFCELSAKSINKEIFSSSEIATPDLIDSFIARTKAAGTNHHHRTHRRHRAMFKRNGSVGIDENGREYINCRKSINKNYAITKRCYRPTNSNDMELGCYAVWDEKNAILQQDCWIQQTISMSNCGVGKCTAKKSSFCCCFGHNCNDRIELSNRSLDNL
ncbi:unnamed protein product [Dracunculus medinensis]|uniref:Activin_recp domain-containing protein n=1 Tax=Dracunculus medinensis TaxID=318479 RepID=A0A0N4U694_DRAME|nr:unnamed protein product [Dracunculus medinensis]